MNTFTLPTARAISPADDFTTDQRRTLASEPMLCAGSVGIRLFCPEDAESMYAAARESINELCQWMVWCRPDYSLDDSTAFVSNCARNWDDGESFSFAIVDAHDGTFLGSAGLSQVNRCHQVANLGYWVRSGCTGRGVASTAVRLVAEFGLRELGFNRLELLIPLGNHASQRVAAKAGAVREGILRDRLLLQDRFCDAIMYSIVSADYDKP